MNSVLTKWSICFPLVFIVFCGCISQQHKHNRFVQYALEFDLLKAHPCINEKAPPHPKLQKLPNDVYIDALRLRQENKHGFYLTAALIICKYGNLQFATWRHSVPLYDDGDFFGEYLLDGNTKYFVLKIVAEAVTGVSRTREVVERVNSKPNIEYEDWITSTLCAWLYFSETLRPTNKLEKALGRAWIKDRNAIELKYKCNLGHLPNEILYLCDE